MPLPEVARSDTAPLELVGLVCPRCGGRRWRTAYTRERPGGVIVRRKHCRDCGHRIFTRETAF